MVNTLQISHQNNILRRASMKMKKVDKKEEAELRAVRRLPVVVAPCVYNYITVYHAVIAKTTHIYYDVLVCT